MPQLYHPVIQMASSQKTEGALKSIVLSLVLCFSSELFAREIKLATITGNVDTDTSYFTVELDDAGNLDTVRFKTVTQEGRVSVDNHFPVQTVDAEGVILMVRNGRNILRLETVKPFSFSTGGQVKLNYLYSGVTNSWKSLQLRLVKAGEDFEIRTLKNERTERFFTKGNWHPVFGLVGIADLVPQF